MRSQKTLLLTITLFILSIIFTSITYAGPPIRLEADVQQNYVLANIPTTVTFSLYDSVTAE